MDAIISATSSPHYTLTYSKMAEKLVTEKPRVLVDLAVPIDIEAKVEKLPGIMRYDIDDFHTEIEACHEAIAYIKVESNRMSHQDSIDCIELMERIGETICRS